MTYRGLEVRGDAIYYDGWKVAVFVTGAPPSVLAKACAEIDLGDYVDSLIGAEVEAALEKAHSE